MIICCFLSALLCSLDVIEAAITSFQQSVWYDLVEHVNDKRQNSSAIAKFLSLDVSFCGLRRHHCSLSFHLQRQRKTMATSSNRSFYKRELPDSCIAFQSRKGKKIFASALMNNGLKSFYALIQQFSTQTEPAYCGLTTLVLVLNALSVDPKQTWKGPWRWFSEEMLNCCVSLDEVQKSGITLQDFRCLAICQGLTAETTYADENDKTGVAKFRQAVQQACVENIQEISCSEDGIHSALVVSYSRKV
jgi:glutathione gamma-glutamylcysteinyltransferase